MAGMALSALIRLSYQRAIMNKKDLSLENIDLPKLLMYIFAFLLVCMVMIFGFIVPNIKEFKAQSRALNSQFASYSKVKYILQNKIETLDTLKNDNRHSINAFLHKFDAQEFINFASNFFGDVKLHSVDDASNEAHKNEYFSYELSVTSFSDTPSKLYSFLDALAKYNNIIKVDFPIYMKGDGEKINTRFNIKVYSNQ